MISISSLPKFQAIPIVKRYAPIALWALCAASFISIADTKAGLGDKTGRLTLSGVFGLAAYVLGKARSPSQQSAPTSVAEPKIFESRSLPVEADTPLIFYVPNGMPTPEDDRHLQQIKAGREQSPQVSRSELIKSVLGGSVDGAFGRRWGEEYDRLVLTTESGRMWVEELLGKGRSVDEVVGLIWVDASDLELSPYWQRWHCKVSEIAINQDLN